MTIADLLTDSIYATDLAAQFTANAAKARDAEERGYCLRTAARMARKAARHAHEAAVMATEAAAAATEAARVATEAEDAAAGV